jgi:subtilisin family serine protease
MALATAINGLRANGVPTFAGSGNNGSGTGMIAPACIANAISVSAVWDEALGSQTWLGCTDSNTQPDLVNCFANSSTTTDIFAPGALILSSKRGGGAQVKAGTSYSSPIAAACAAVLLEAEPGITPGQIESAMKASSVIVTDPKNGFSFPRLQCDEAVAALLPRVPALPWPAAAGLALLLLAAARPILRSRG